MLSGFLNLNKPSGWTSHDCVARLRRLLNTKKIGHAGTLDPLATGVLPVAVGSATKLLQYLSEAKAYRAVIRFGLTTSTDDLEGEALTTCLASHLQQADVAALLPRLTGRLRQTPPMYSAVQVGGKRLYDLARKGKTIDIPTRSVVVKQWRILSWQPGEQPELTAEISCGPGTYIRSLARDLGEAAGTGATLVKLVRTRSGGFDLAGSTSIAALEIALAEGSFALDPVGPAVAHLPPVRLPPELARRWCLGQKLALTTKGDRGPNQADQIVGINDVRQSQPLRVLSQATDTFLGIGEITAYSPPSDRPTPNHLMAATTVLVPKRVQVASPS